MKNIETQKKCIENMQTMKHCTCEMDPERKKALLMVLGLITSPIWVPVAFWWDVLNHPRKWRDFLYHLLGKNQTCPEGCQDGFGVLAILGGAGFTILDVFLLYKLVIGVKSALKP